MSIKKWLNDNIAAINPYQPGRPIEEVARELGLDPDTVIKVASNENPLGASTKALAALEETLNETHLYPDGGGYYLRQRLAQKHRTDMDQIILGAGSNEILEFIGHCYMAPGRSIVVSAHAFVIYKLIARMFDCRVIEVPTKGLGHDLPAMLDAIEDDTCAVFICNPNNPTGTLLRQPEIDDFMARVPEEILVVFDEAYAEIALGPMPKTVEYVHQGRDCLVLRTFSKAYGLAGLRIGYAVGPREIIGALQKARQPFNANRLAQAAALAAVDDAEFVGRSRKLFAEGKEYLEKACEEMGLDYEPTYTNFMLIKVGNGAGVTEALTQRGVIVRPMQGYGLPQYIRVSMGLMEENERFVNTLKEVLVK